MAVEQPPQQDLLELEIGAFMGPHIKRARIALVLIGLLYAWVVISTWGDISKWHDAMKGVRGGDPRMAELEHAVNIAYYFIVFTGVVCVANIVLAAIAGKMTTVAIYTAMGLFIAHSCFELYVYGILLFTSWVFWLGAISLGLGFQAAHKAAKLRKERGVSPAAAA